eukprot:359522-Chlamydomonas_euryale.AAC.9
MPACNPSPFSAVGVLAPHWNYWLRSNSQGSTCPRNFEYGSIARRALAPPPPAAVLEPSGLHTTALPTCQPIRRIPTLYPDAFLKCWILAEPRETRDRRRRGTASLHIRRACAYRCREIEIDKQSLSRFHRNTLVDTLCHDIDRLVCADRSVTAFHRRPGHGRGDRIGAVRNRLRAVFGDVVCTWPRRGVSAAGRLPALSRLCGRSGPHDWLTREAEDGRWANGARAAPAPPAAALTRSRRRHEASWRGQQPQRGSREREHVSW